MQIESRKNIRNKNAKRLNLLKGRQPHNPSQTNGGAKIRINSEIAIPKLKKLAQDYIGVTDPQGFLTDLRIALGIPNSQGASKYGEVTIPKEDGSELKASLRITNHQANAEQYIKHNANCEYNLSIVVRRKERRNTFTPHEDVRLDEYVYYGKNIAQVENPLSQIVNGIIEFLQNGKYEDTTGVALRNTSPQQANNRENNQEIKENRIMNKKQTIRLNESQLKRVVAESVKLALNEEIFNKLPNVDKLTPTERDLYEHLHYYQMLLGKIYAEVDKISGKRHDYVGGDMPTNKSLANIIKCVKEINGYFDKVERAVQLKSFES